MIYRDITKYVNARNNYQQISARITKDGMEYLIHGEWTKNKPPVPEYSKYDPTNPDKTFIQ